ncbi:hypothetical protein BH11MYX3_BH11MYX3_12110 [soil metagenome]
MTPRHVVLLFVIGASGCDAAYSAPEPPTTGRFEHDMMVRFHMHENFDLLRAVEKLLLRGRLADATSLARAIAEAPDEPGLGTWAVQATKVRDLAAALGRAPNLDEACKREARLAVACAGCHADVGLAAELTAVPVLPPDKPQIAVRMARHLWATDRLWEAIVMGGNDPWKQGLDVLAATPLPFDTGTYGRSGFAKQLQQLATGARKQSSKDDLPARGRVYGEMLTVCVGCHTAPVDVTLPSAK